MRIIRQCDILWVDNLSLLMYASLMSMTKRHPLKTRIIEMGITQERLALVLGIDPSLLGRYLRGIRPMPADLKARIRAALDELEEERQVAAEAVEKLRAERLENEKRERVLAEETE